MTVPTFAEVHQILSAATMRDLIRRDDLPDDPHWWLAVISVGQSALLGAESGRADAEEWASVLAEGGRRGELDGRHPGGTDPAVSGGGSSPRRGAA